MIVRFMVFCFLAAVFVGTEGYLYRVCEHRQMTLNCGSRFIDILSASYGRTLQWVCGYGRNTRCHSGRSMAVVKHECQGQPKCTLHAKNSAFGDPCYGTVKYLQVNWQCVPAPCPGLLLRVCEGTSRLIYCRRGSKKINILSANYGRLTGGHICPGPVRTTNCRARMSLTKVRNVCQGKRYCYLHANNGKFGDPCYGTKKYLEVRYKCE